MDPLLLGKVREQRSEQPFDRARLRRQSRNSGDVQVRRFGPEQKIRVEIDDGVGSTGAIDADRNSGVRAFLQIAVHPQRDLHVVLVGEKDLPHRHRLERLFRNLPQHGGGVEPDLRPLR